MAFKTKKVKDAAVQSDINVTPMVDVMLVLLIIFMVITPMLSKGKDVDMAKVDAPEKMQDADKDDALLVAVTKDGAIYLGTEKMDAAQLTDKLKDKLTNRTDKQVFLKADHRAKFGLVVDVVDNIRDAGVDQLGLLTEQRKAPGAPPAAGK
jgi:biopolymer transport protein ExbD/biopolymer transport protein TolR